MADIAALVAARYGTPTGSASTSSNLSNPTLETLLQHKSIRQFLPEKVSPEELSVLVAAGQSAATSSNLQTWSLVAVQDPDRKAIAATLSGDQDFIRKAPLYLVFCADLSRLTRVSEQEQTPGEGLEYTEMFLMASFDAAFAAQNIAVAAESLGLGICYVGGARNNPRELATLLHLPPRVIALFGMAVGRPDPARPASVKPRLPREEVLHLEIWDDNGQSERIAAYDETLAKFNAGEKRDDIPKWTLRSARRVATKKALNGRHVWREVLNERGFHLL